MAMNRNGERMNSRAVIYSRLSLRNRPDGSESCEKQIEICQRYCDFCKLEVIGVFYDKNKSGAKAANRPGLQLALHKTIKNQAILVVHSLSRLAWNTKETLKIIERLRGTTEEWEMGKRYLNKDVENEINALNQNKI
jgi:DNA invertase Pin-like site-specific DNA recombinase